MNKNAVCITVYKHRSKTMLDNVKHIDKTKYDVYIVAQKNDPNLSEYDQYLDNGITVLSPEVTSIFQKREYIRTEMSDRGYDGFFMIDDDVKYLAYKITPESKRSTSETYKFFKCDFNEMLDKMVEASINHNAGYVSLTRWGYIGWQKPGVVKINNSINVAQFGYFHVGLMNKYNLHYDTTGWINEDTDMVIQMLQNGVNCAIVSDYMFETTNIMYQNMNTTTLYGDIEENYKFVLHQAVKYHVPLYINKKGFLKPRINYRKYWKTFELPEFPDNKLLELCKADDVKGVIEHLKTANYN